MRCSSLTVLAFALAVGTAMSSASASDKPRQRDRGPDPKPKPKPKPRPKRDGEDPLTRPPPDLALEDEREIDDLIRRAVEQQDQPIKKLKIEPGQEQDVYGSYAAEDDEKPAPIIGPPRPPVNQRPGVDLATARKMAPSLAQHLTRAGRANYDRRLVRTFQTRAGLVADGIYGGATRGALLYFQASNAPQSFFKPTTTIPYDGPLPL